MKPISGLRFLFIPVLLAGVLASSGRASPSEPAAAIPGSAGAVAGEWGVQIKRADHTEEAVLRFKLEGSHLTGSLKREKGDPIDLTNIQLAGGKISFDLDEFTGTMRFQGMIDGDLMWGKWKKQRPSDESGSTFSFGGAGGSSRGRHGSRHEGETNPDERGSHEWTAFHRHQSEAEKLTASTSEKPAGTTAAATVQNPELQGTAADYRFHVSRGAISQKEPIVLTSEGARVAFASSFSIPEARFVPEPYVGKCKLTAVKFTLKEEDKKAILGERYKPVTLDDQDDTMVPHSAELRNAAGKFGANSIYLLLSDSDEIQNVPLLQNCTIVSKDGNRYRGEWLNEVACKNAEGKTFKFSQYAGRANFYSCGAPKK